MHKDTKANQRGAKTDGSGGEDQRATRRPDLERQTLVTGADALAAAQPETKIDAMLGDRYQVVAELGRGAYGIVYRARDRVADEEVAVKLLAPQVAASPKAIERFRRELRAARRITHPGVVRIHDLVEVDSRLLLSMELVEGQSLDVKLRAKPRLPAAELAAMALDIARALAAAHRAGVTHRDLKPANIMVRSSNGRLVVADFGVSRLAELVDSPQAAATATAGDPSLTNDGTLIGTPLYMAPEQLEGADSVGPRCDVYAFGVVVFELATGKAPHECSELNELLERRLNHAAPSLHSLRPDLPGWLCGLVDRCLSRDPAARPESGVELKQEILAAMGERKRRLLPLAVLATLLLVLGGGATWWWSRGQLPAGERRLAFRVHNLGGHDDDWIAPAAERLARRRLVNEETRLDATDDPARANVLVDVDYRHDQGGIHLDARLGPAGAYARSSPLEPIRAPSVAEAIAQLITQLSARAAAGQPVRGPNERERAEMIELGAPSLAAYRKYSSMVYELYGLVATDWNKLRGDSEQLLKEAPGWAHVYAFYSSVLPEETGVRADTLAALDKVDKERDPAGRDLLDAITHPYTAETIAELERNFAAHPRDVLVGWQLTTELRKARRSDENAAVMRRLHQDWPDLQFGSDLATALRTLGRGDEVPALIDDWIKQAPDNELALVQRVLTDVSRHHPELAARHAHDLVLLQGAGPVRLSTLCDVLMLIDHLGEARQRADELLEASGADRMVGWSRKAQLALLEGKFAPAVDALTKVVTLPDNDITGDMLYALDDLRRVARRVGNAPLELEMAQKLAVMWKEIPAREAVFQYRYDVLREGKCPPLERALGKVPPGEPFATARLNIIRAAATAGCATRAEVVKAGMLPDESDMGSLFEFALAAEAEGALGLARDALEKVREIHVLSIDSTSSVTPYCAILARYHLGKVLQKLGQRAEARAQYQDFLDHWGHADRGIPEVDDARAALARL